MGRLGRFIRRNRGTLGAVLVATLGLVACFWPHAQRPREALAQTHRNSDGAAGFDFSPDGRSMLFWAEGGKILVRDLESGRVVALPIDDPAPPTVHHSVNQARFVDGGRAVFGHLIEVDRPGVNFHEFRIWDAATGRVKVRMPEVGSGAAWPHSAASDEGSTLAWAPRYEEHYARTPSVGVWRASWGDQPRMFPGVVPVAISADGKVLAAVEPGEKPNSIAVWEVETSRRMATLAVDPYAGGRGIALSPGGGLLAENVMTGSTLWDVLASSPRASLGQGAFGPPRFLRGGSLVVIGNVPSGEDICQVWDVAARPAREIYRGPIADISKDDRTMLVPGDPATAPTASGLMARLPTVDVIRLPALGRIGRISRESAEFHRLSRDGRTVAMLSRRIQGMPNRWLVRWLPGWAFALLRTPPREVREIEVVNVESGRRIVAIPLDGRTSSHRLDGSIYEGASFAFTPDGKTLAVHRAASEDEGSSLTKVELWDLSPPIPTWPAAALMAALALGVGRWYDVRSRRRANLAAAAT